MSAEIPHVETYLTSYYRSRKRSNCDSDDSQDERDAEEVALFLRPTRRRKLNGQGESKSDDGWSSSSGSDDNQDPGTQTTGAICDPASPTQGSARGAGDNANHFDANSSPPSSPRAEDGRTADDHGSSDSGSGSSPRIVYSREGAPSPEIRLGRLPNLPIRTSPTPAPRVPLTNAGPALGRFRPGPLKRQNAQVWRRNDQLDTIEPVMYGQVLREEEIAEDTSTRPRKATAVNERGKAQTEKRITRSNTRGGGSK